MKLIRFIKRFFRSLGAFLKAAYLRTKTDAPAFWRKLGKFFVWVFTICVAIQDPVLKMVDELVPLGVVPEHWLQTLTSYIAAGAAVGKMVTLFAVDPNKLSPTKYEALKDPTHVP